MSRYWIVNTDDLALLELVTSDIRSFGSGQTILQIPEELVAGNMKPELVDDELVLVEDLTKSSPLWNSLRKLRNLKLQECDWTQLTDSPLSEEEKDAWASYRQELRDMPTNMTDPEIPVWPTPP
jgi:hypothetical protein